MTSTTYVQFIKGGLLIICSTVLVVLVCQRGISKQPSAEYHQFQTLPAVMTGDEITGVGDERYTLAGTQKIAKTGQTFAKLTHEGTSRWWRLIRSEGQPAALQETMTIVKTVDGRVLYNGAPKAEGQFFQVGHVQQVVQNGQEVEATGPIGPIEYLRVVGDSTIVRFTKVAFEDGKDKVSLWHHAPTAGERVLRPGLKVPIDEKAPLTSKLNFISLMLALFFGTAALPHILIRYYTVPSAAAARKSTIVAISAIGFFYILTLFLGLGAMVNGVLDVESDNMSAPLLARSFGTILFAIISALAFATVLGTVSGLIVAASGAVAHDFMDRFLRLKLSDRGKVNAGKLSAVVVGGIAIVLGILFKGVNVSFLVGLAFAVAASANLPAILMLIFWKRTSSKGIAASVVVGIVASVGWIAFSPDLYDVYGLGAANAPLPFSNPGLFSIPLSFLTLVIVSLLTPSSRSTSTTSA